MTKRGAKQGPLSVVFNDMTVTLPTDQICAVLGRPGSGRTTLLRLLCGQERPDRGRIVTDIAFSVISNGGSFFQASMTCEENITIAARLYGMDAEQLMELVMGISNFGSLWQMPASAVPVPRRRAMELLLASLLPFDCYLVDNIEHVDTATFATVLQLIKLRQAGIIFTAQNPKYAREFATFGGVIMDQTVYAFSSVDEALNHYA